MGDDCVCVCNDPRVFKDFYMQSLENIKYSCDFFGWGVGNSKIEL